MARSGEKPSEALQSRGVEYIEVRALDVNPFADTGINQQQIYFLDIFLTYCALAESPLLDCTKQNVYESNMDEVVVRGRDPQLLLKDEGINKSVKEWGTELFNDMQQVAELLDKAYKCNKYSTALAIEAEKLADSSLTPSAQILSIVVEKEQSLTQFALAKAKGYRAETLKNDYQYYSQQYFIDQAEISHQKQTEIKEADNVDFDTFIEQYFK